MNLMECNGIKETKRERNGMREAKHEVNEIIQSIQLTELKGVELI